MPKSKAAEIIDIISQAGIIVKRNLVYWAPVKIIEKTIRYKYNGTLGPGLAFKAIGKDGMYASI
ncbi:MAG: hypothetical protein A2V21_306275 [Deltaproteobacteria bacterium GWC2_55_46]|nr:MAG: hypothetical protein A2Z79_00370 [Deltaproteobacteria bacterium GWA2_55_82]OIJ73905.1 MAG: hypothetical protein A2V21_306275 [Deltaproteobacteria bacterium GWC2_55_46]